LLILLCLPMIGFGQNEGNIWYFGTNAGLDFNSGSPVALMNGMLQTLEGCATISDHNGDLLFYTDGMTVYNKNHSIMPNGIGLLGHSSSTQSSIIVKKPGVSTIFYIITVNGISGPGPGLCYSEVDMTLQGGLGDVNSNKNILIVGNTCEKVTTICKDNGIDFWLVTKIEGSNNYNSFSITSSGINLTPVVSTIGISTTGTGGYLKSSSDGNRIASTYIWSSYPIEVFDFDKSTGFLSNCLTLVPHGSYYGSEFSPNNNVFYVASHSSGGVLQYNLNAGTVNDINNSMTVISGTGSLGAMQLAPDGKIYLSRPSPSLSVINNPNILGSGCGFNQDAVYLGGRLATYGLPTFYNCVFVATNNFTFNNPCYGDSAIFNISNMSVDSVLWDFGDPNSGINNFSTDIHPFHIFSDTGTFHITLYSYFNGMIDTLVNDLFVAAIPAPNLGNDTIICEGEVLTLDATLQNATYLWQDNSTNPTYDIFDAGEYFVEITVGGCSNIDTINVIYSALPQVTISGNYEVCAGNQVIIGGIVTGSFPLEITYTNGSDTNVIYVNDSIIIEASQAGIYEIINILDQFDCIGNYSGSANIIINPCSLDVYVPNVFTPNSDVHNEVFIPSIYHINDVVDYNIKIFNRWGESVYETNEIDKHWDGKYNNTNVQQGVYVYIITITDIYENFYNLNGYICLIR
ncbi:MAG: gliding motility-associated C-terminal domain-containing protein, partial [Bacteroidota bacterium]|nr:gliding motility-associated C-terminal domain-containing protein [Bacteroidota bacterium]